MSTAKKIPKKKTKRKVTKNKLATIFLPDSPAEECSKACTILKHTHDSCEAFLKAYRLARGVRRLQHLFDRQEAGLPPPEKMRLMVRGISTDEEQDLLRAMLVTAASGLDATTKQLIKDALPSLLQWDDSALQGLQGFVERRIKKQPDTPDELSGARFLSKILTAPAIQQSLIVEYIEALTGGSLQSLNELHKAVDALAITIDSLRHDKERFKLIFATRNKIIHELDINLEARYRNRNVRNEKEMREYTDKLIQTAGEILRAVNKKFD